MKLFWKITWCLLFALALAVAFYLIRPVGSLPARQLPSPNAYVEFRLAGETVLKDTPDLKSATPSQILAHLDANREALDRVRRALSMKSAVNWVEAPNYTTSHLPELNAIKKAGLLLICEAALAEKEHRPKDALKATLEALTFARLAGAEGLVIDKLVANAIAQSAAMRLLALVPQLDPGQRRLAVQELTKLDEAEEPEEKVADRDLHVCLQGPAATRVGYRVVDLVSRLKGSRTVTQEARAVLKLHQARRRLLTAQVAMTCFQAEKGRSIVRLEELCPDFLKEPPQDPFATNAPLLFKKNGDKPLVYSIGPDGKDDQGRPVKPTAPSAGGDLLAPEAPKG